LAGTLFNLHRGPWKRVGPPNLSNFYFQEKGLKFSQRLFKKLPKLFLTGGWGANFSPKGAQKTFWGKTFFTLKKIFFKICGKPFLKGREKRLSGGPSFPKKKFSPAPGGFFI